MTHCRTLASMWIVLTVAGCGGKLNRWLHLVVGEDGVPHVVGPIAGTPGAAPVAMNPADAMVAQPSRLDASADASIQTEVELACDFDALLLAKCGSPKCHGAGVLTGGLDLISPALANRLRGRNGAGACSDARLIDVKDPEQSVLYLRVAAAQCGERMPPTAALSQREQACILSGIVELARQDTMRTQFDSGVMADAASQPDAARRDAAAPDAVLADAAAPDARETLDAAAAQPEAAASDPLNSACDPTNLFQRKCGDEACHRSPALHTGLDLTSASLAQRLEDRAATVACRDKLLVDRNNPAQSALYLKVSSSRCGTRMPVGNALAADEQACILSWIESL